MRDLFLAAPFCDLTLSERACRNSYLHGFRAVFNGCCLDNIFYFNFHPRTMRTELLSIERLQNYEPPKQEAETVLDELPLKQQRIYNVVQYSNAEQIRGSKRNRNIITLPHPNSAENTIQKSRS